MQRTIITASRFYPESAERIAERAFVSCPPANLALIGDLLTELGKVSDGITVTARVNHGRWLADCPFCSSAQICDPADPFFLCAGADGCANEPVAGAFVPIDFPADREAIEQLLGARAKQATVHWEGEPLEQLLAENELLKGDDGLLPENR